jgi:hypothetical protein
LAIGVHPYVTGAAHRIKYFEELYAYINRHDGVVHWTGQEIFRLVSPDRATAGLTYAFAAGSGTRGKRRSAQGGMMGCTAWQQSSNPALPFHACR